MCSAKLLNTFFEVVVVVTSLFFLSNGRGNVTTLKRVMSTLLSCRVQRHLIHFVLLLNSSIENDSKYWYNCMKHVLFWKRKG